MLFDKVIAYDHLKQKIVLIVNMKTDQRDGELRGKGMCGARGAWRHHRRPKPAAPAAQSHRRPTHLQRHRGAVRYDIVEKPVRYISDGDIFQAVGRGSFQSVSGQPAFGVPRAPPTNPRLTWCSFLH